MAKMEVMEAHSVKLAQVPQHATEVSMRQAGH